MTCRGDGHEAKTMFRIEKDGDGGIHNGDTVSLRSYEDKYVGAFKEKVTADWDTYESSGMITDDKPEPALALVADNGTFFPDDTDGFGFPAGDDDGPDMGPDNNNGWGFGGPASGAGPGGGKLPPLPGGIQIAFVIEKEQAGTNYIRVGDQIHLRTYTTKHIDVQGEKVQ